MLTVKEIKESVLHLFFPHICTGCGSDILNVESALCMRCVDAMPETNFELHPDNPVEKSFWGRLPLIGATAQFYFTKESLKQGTGYSIGQDDGRTDYELRPFSYRCIGPPATFPGKRKKEGI